MTVAVRRAADRFNTDSDGISSRHSFSFGRHYDPANVGHALLVAHNDDVIVPGGGYDPHPHQDMEILTWVLDGGLRHEDSRGNAGVVVPGLIQRLSAGRGVLHSERNDAAGGRSVRFVQMWVLPDEPGTDPAYAHCDVSASLHSPELVTVASGLPRHRETAALPIGASGVALHVVRLRPGAAVELPDAPFVHLFVASGSADLEEAGRLDEADAARLTAAGPRRLVAGSLGCEVLSWEMWRSA